MDYGDEGSPRAVFGIWSAGRHDVWAVGVRGLILRGDGNDFTLERSPTTESLTSVWGAASKDVWAVGTAGVILHYVPEAQP
jgi:photosystem II stability/assembly factor-like uncharacterized protein